MIRLNLLRLAVITLTVLCSVGCAAIPPSDFNHEVVLGNSDKYLAFIGQKVSVTEFDPSESEPEEVDPDTIIIYMNAVFKARYRVLQVIHGEYDQASIDFIALDHYGYPNFAKQKYALIYLREYEGELFHLKYAYDTVYPTADGRFAGCGDPYTDLDDDDFVTRSLERIDFEPPVTLRVSDYWIPKKDRKNYEEDEIAEADAKAQRFFSAPAFDVRGDLATCKMGVYADELFRIEWETKIMPSERRDYCEAHHELKDVWRDPEQKKVLDACMEDLKEKSFPF